MTPTEPTPARLKLGILITLAANLFFAAASSLVFAFHGRFPTIQIIFIQNVISLLLILPLALRNGFRSIKTNELPTHLLRDLFGIGSYFLYFLAIRNLNLIDATTLNYTTPFFIPFIWWIWQREKIQPSIWWSIIVGFFGVATMLNPTKEIFQLGFLYGIFAGITASIALSAMRILNVKKEPLDRTLFYFFSVGTLLSLPFAAAVWVSPTQQEWWLSLGIGGSTAIAQILLTIAYRHGTASFLSPLGYTTVIYNALIAYFIFSQELTWHSYVGGALIIVGGTMTYLFKKHPASALKAFEHPAPKNQP